MENQSQRRYGGKNAPVRSVRVPDDLWEAARRRANDEDVTMSHVLQTFIKGYADGQLSMPRVIIEYDQPWQASAAPPTAG